MEPSFIYQRIINILNGIDFIGKDKRNQIQNYNFRGIDDFYNELHPIFAKNGVFICPKVIKVDREERQSAKDKALIWTLVLVEFTFSTADGSSVQATMIGEAMDSGDKGCNKAVSAALKYVLLVMFLIPTEDKKDTEEETHEIISRKGEVLSLIEKSQEAKDLTILKEMYPDLFAKDQDVKAAGIKRHSEIMTILNLNNHE